MFSNRITLHQLLMTNRKKIYKAIMTICAIVLVLCLYDGIFGGSRRDGSVHPPIELKAFPLKIITWITYGGIPLSAICLLGDEETKYAKGQRKSKPYMRYKYYKCSLVLLLLLLLVCYILVRYIGVWSITEMGKLQLDIVTSWRKAILIVIMLYFPRMIILSLSIAYILQLWHESQE